MDEQEAIIAIRNDLILLLGQNPITRTDLCRIMSDCNNRELYIHVDRMGGYWILRIQEHCIRFRAGTNYQEVFEEFARRTNRKIYITPRVMGGNRNADMENVVVSNCSWKAQEPLAEPVADNSDFNHGTVAFIDPNDIVLPQERMSNLYARYSNMNVDGLLDRPDVPF